LVYQSSFPAKKPENEPIDSPLIARPDLPDPPVLPPPALPPAPLVADGEGAGTDAAEEVTIWRADEVGITMGSAIWVEVGITAA
jgi:hypothetical protein